ncbi:hypothetical protein M438DRAFT_330979 [Aureobasidium pullulans EXF-150]|uniref:C2H2-type domain-containing protein n=1 Tax=Aureobasidium pullulans EXF-150 TaxID=1043002 RepID=A0A074XWZ9_AURPU|nr:uncharacterized protein M438DRAFT_330979 [Aureobasidium pullulans EXF-150]KEQ90025.1 hypothetical protein M438DRAFT_330979 [Aureobasidium pullulans EXF-150]
MSNSRNSTRPMLAPGSRKRSGSTTDDYQPTTPRLNARFSDHPAEEILAEESTSNTPTRGTFKFPADNSIGSEQHGDNTGVTRENSRRSVHSHQSSDSQDIDMGDDDDDGHDQAGSDNESDDDEKPSRKKKKGQRFYCTDFPPCNLSFTRSEHLARHIRKHTGERPFECHCSRRFSRLDNLRQHAQTVHVNEEIPGDSLAATGTRFQRQIRTDRVRPPNVRPRASTASSGGHGHGAYSRGHSRNLSASSVLSTTSSLAMSDIGESRPRPSPLMLNQDPVARARLSLDTFNPAIPNNGPQFGYYQQAPSGYSSPTSSTFSTGEGSPRFQATMQSPSLPIARSSFYNGSRTPSRRLSVPSGISPYSPQTATYQPVYFAPLPSGPTPQYSNTNSMVASPTASTFSHQRRESDAELEWRRRTWHPGTHASYASRPATSGLAYNQTPDDAAPAASSQPAASQITRLPGIESFDHVPPSAAPARNVTSPMQVDSGRRPSVVSGPVEVSASVPGDRRSTGWEHNLHHNLNRLEIAQASTHPPVDPSRILPSQRPTTAPHSGLHQQPAPGYALPQLQPPVDIRPAADERANKRQGWYGGPMGPPQGSQPIMIAHRTSPESSSSEGIPTPSTSQGRELHPAIMHANGMVELQPPDAVLTDEQRALQAQFQGKPEPIRADSGFHSYVHMPGQAPNVYMMQAGHNMQMQQSPEWRPAPVNQRANPDMGRLEALVAVATSENRAVEHRR